jgi:hypothetical protein
VPLLRCLVIEDLVPYNDSCTTEAEEISKELYIRCPVRSAIPELLTRSTNNIYLVGKPDCLAQHTARTLLQHCKFLDIPYNSQGQTHISLKKSDILVRKEKLQRM